MTGYRLAHSDTHTHTHTRTHSHTHKHTHSTLQTPRCHKLKRRDNANANNEVHRTGQNGNECRDTRTLAHTYTFGAMDRVLTSRRRCLTQVGALRGWGAAFLSAPHRVVPPAAATGAPAAPISSPRRFAVHYTRELCRRVRRQLEECHPFCTTGEEYQRLH